MSTKRQPAPSQEASAPKERSKKAAPKPSPLKLSPKIPKVDEAKPVRGTYSEKWSLHPGEALRLKRGISAKDQQARARHPVVTSQDVFESPKLRAKAFHADKDCLIFCGGCP